MRYSQDNKKVTKLTYFYVFSFVALFLAIVVFLVLYITQPFAYKELDDLPEIEMEEVLTKHVSESGSQTSYYVLIYSEESKENKLIEEVVLEYANLVRTQGKDGKLAKIYLLEYSKEYDAKLKEISSKITSEDACPVLIKVASQKVSSSAIDFTTSEINDCLGDLIYDNNKK